MTNRSQPLSKDRFKRVGRCAPPMLCSVQDAVGTEKERLKILSSGAFAADISQAVVVLELHGPMLDDWMAHMVDSTSVPREPGRATRARLADCAVMLLRLAPDRVWLLSDRPVAAYIEDWLAYSHQGTFGAG